MPALLPLALLLSAIAPGGAIASAPAAPAAVSQVSPPAAAPTALSLAAADEPLPLRKTVTLRDGNYTVSGRQVLPRNANLTILRGMRIRGDSDAVIELEGSIKFKAVTGGKVVLENVWLEITPKCREILLSNVEFRGGGIRAHASGPADANLFLVAVEFTGSASMTLEMEGGEADLQNMKSAAPMKIIGVPRSERSGSQLDLMMLSCQPLSGGLHVQGVRKAVVRNCNFGGPLSSFVDNTSLEFDGNTVHSRELEFRVSRYGGFKRTEIKNSDFHCKRLKLLSPPSGDKKERVTLTFSWFRDLRDEEEIRADMIHDSDDDPKIGALAGFKKILPRAIQLGGK